MSTTAQQYPEDWSEDGALVRASLAGDAGAFEELYRRYRPGLVAYLTYQVRDRVLAEDLFQEAMTHAYAGREGFDPRYPLWPWLHKIAKNVVISDATRRAREVPTGDPGPDASYEDNTASVITLAEVEACLARVTPRQRRALVDRYLLDRDPNELAAESGLTRTAFEQLMWRARTNARKGGRWTVVPAALRSRRVMTGFFNRIQSALSTGFTVAGDVAMSAAVTVGGVTLAAGAMTHLVTHHAHPVAAEIAPQVATTYARPQAETTATVIALAAAQPEKVFAPDPITKAERTRTTEQTQTQTQDDTPETTVTPPPATAPPAKPWNDGAASYPTDPTPAPQPSSGPADIETTDGGVTVSGGTSDSDTPVQAGGEVTASGLEDGGKDPNASDSVILEAGDKGVAMAGGVTTNLKQACNPIDVVDCPLT